MIFSLAKELNKKFVLGINSRNSDYINIYNHRKNYPLADNKILTKEIATRAGLPVPELYGVISSIHEIKNLEEKISTYDSFVIKPAQGSGGEGVFVIRKDERGRFFRANEKEIGMQAIRLHIANIIHGLFSLGGQDDFAMIERRVKFMDCFSQISYRGVPDIRVIIFMGVPVMAMMRLPTRDSNGRANLHQGALGAGIDMRTGRLRTAVKGSNIVDKHPDTNFSICGFQIPFWEEILNISASVYNHFDLGYFGVDIVLDDEFGPMILEINARPGLAIQIANISGLKGRLELVKRNYKKLDSLKKKIDFMRQIERV